jgi:hypothetical protein
MSIPDPRFQGKPLLDFPWGGYYLVLENADPSRYVEMTYEMMRM